MKSLISIIIPIYNVEPYLHRCIRSILSQTYTNLEIILVDDGSPDNCPKICDEYAHKDNRIKVIHKKNAGLGLARNSGLEICTGDFVMFVDSDDYLSHDCVDVLYNRITQDRSDMAIGKHTDVFDNGKTNDAYCNWYKNSILSRDELLEGFGSGKTISVSAWAKLYSRNIIKHISYPPLKCSEDVWVLVDVLKSCQKVSLVDEVVYYYYQRKSSISHSFDNAKRIDALIAYLRLVAYLADEKHHTGSAHLFSFCINLALSINKMSDRTKYFKQYLDNNTRRVLLKEMSFRTKIKWCGLFLPYANRGKFLIASIKKKVCALCT